MLVQAKLRVGVLLVELENELRALGWWESQAPAAQALQSQQPFCVDTLELSQWLQWIFIPRMQSIVLTQQPLPKQCAIFEMATVVYRENNLETAALQRCLKNIDAAIMSQQVLH